MKDKIKLTDLRNITRDSDKVFTKVYVYIGTMETSRPWLLLGRSSLSFSERYGRGPQASLKAYLDNATDGEHDSAYALSLPLVGVSLESVYHGLTKVNAWVDPTPPEQGCTPDFRVPEPGYDPMTYGGVVCDWKECVEAGGEHMIVENYLPPYEPELHEAVRGLPVTIVWGDAAIDWKKE